MITKIHELLGRLGITANYTGFFYVSYAVLLAVEDIERLSLVTKRLYPEVASHYNTTALCVERNIRTVIHTAWAQNPQFMSQFTNGQETGKPTVSQFIAILTTYIMKNL